MSSATASSRRPAFRPMRPIGFQASSRSTPTSGERRTRENIAFPAFYVGGAHSGSQRPRWACTGPINMSGTMRSRRDLQNLKQTLQGVAPIDVFMPSVSPSSCAGFMENRYYRARRSMFSPSRRGDARGIRGDRRGRLPGGKSMIRAWPCITCSPPTKTSIRRAPGRAGGSRRSTTRCAIFHRSAYDITPATASTWAPRTSDMEMKQPRRYHRDHSGGFLFLRNGEPAPRTRMATSGNGVKLPDDKVLIPGCITHCVRYRRGIPNSWPSASYGSPKSFGRERVIAGTDCGFASTLVPGQRPEIEPEIVWAKFKSLAEGARIASRALWA